MELSAAGLFSPAMTVPVTIDAWTQQVYAVNTNALYRLSYQSFTYTGANQYNVACVQECLSNFADDQKAFYALTALGSNASYGPTFSSATAPSISASSRSLASWNRPCSIRSSMARSR